MSYIRIYGPPLKEALKALEKVAEELSEIKAVYSVFRAVPTPVFVEA